MLHPLTLITAIPVKEEGREMFAVPRPLTTVVVAVPNEVPLCESNAATLTPALTPPSAGVTLIELLALVVVPPLPPPPPPQAASAIESNSVMARLRKIIKVKNYSFDDYVPELVLFPLSSVREGLKTTKVWTLVV